MRTLYFLAALLIGCGGLPRLNANARPAPPTETLAEAKRLYYEGIGGNKESILQSKRLFSDLALAEPGNLEVQAYRGSLMLLEAGSTWAVWKKYELSKTGMALLDEAVRADPSNLEVRFVRAATTMHLPKFFSREQQSKDDLRVIAKNAKSAVQNGKLDPRIAAAGLFFYAERVATEDERKPVLEEASRLAPDSPAGKEAFATLQKMRAK